MENIITNRNIALANADYRDRSLGHEKGDEFKNKSSKTNDRNSKKERKTRTNSKCKEVIHKKNIILESDSKEEKNEDGDKIIIRKESPECYVVSRNSGAPGSKESDEFLNIHNVSVSSFLNCKPCSNTITSSGSQNEDLQKGFTDVIITLQPQVDSTEENINSKSSFDADISNRRVSSSKSEMDLHVIGRSPLQRKSSIFRKTLNSLVRNTSEVFRRQSEKREKKPNKMSHSLQSLQDHRGELQGLIMNPSESKLLGNKCTNISSTTSLDRRSGSSVCSTISDGIGQRGSNSTTSSMQSLNVLPLNEAIISNRAVSVSSGLDSVHQPKRSNEAARNNRFTWMASESVAEYLRRTVQEEIASRTGRDNHGSSNSFKGSNTKIAEPNKGRRLSYQRAVSGEDPVLPNRFTDRRQYRIPEDNDEINSAKAAQFSLLLHNFTKDGVPKLDGFEQEEIEDGGYGPLSSLTEQTLDELMKTAEGFLQPTRLGQAIKELVLTEAGFITQIQFIVIELMAAAQSAQLQGHLTHVNMEMVFCNIPDVLNGHIQFWNNTLHPMLTDAIQNKVHFNTNLMMDGFSKLKCMFNPYRRYAALQQSVEEYIRAQMQYKAFREFRDWCAVQKTANRQHLADLMMKPIQRLTKYSLLIQAILNETTDISKKETLEIMLDISRDFVNMLNLLVRHREERDTIARLIKIIGPLELDCRDDAMQTFFRQYNDIMLNAPILGCPSYIQRSLIYEGDMKFRDATTQKIDVRVFLLTDMLLICKRLTGRNLQYQFRLIRPKYLVERLMYSPSTPFYKGPNIPEVQHIICVVTDETGTANACFTLHSAAREPNIDSMNLYHKLQEATHTLNYARLDSSNTSFSSSYALEESKPEIIEHDEMLPFMIRSQASIRRDAKERVIVMRMGYKDRANVSYENITSLDDQQYYYFGLDSRSQREHRPDPKKHQLHDLNNADEEFRSHGKDEEIQADSLFSVSENDYGNSHHELMIPLKKSVSKMIYTTHQAKLTKLETEMMDRPDGLLYKRALSSERGISFPPPANSNRTLRKGMAVATTSKELKPPTQQNVHLGRARSANAVNLEADDVDNKNRHHQSVFALNETLLLVRKKNKALFSSHSDITDDDENTWLSDKPSSHEN